MSQAELFPFAAASGPKTWRAYAEAFVRRFLKTSAPEFVSDDLWRAGLKRPPELRWLGQVLKSLEADGVVANTGRLKTTTLKGRRGDHKAVWRRI